MKIKGKFFQTVRAKFLFAAVFSGLSQLALADTYVIGHLIPDTDAITSALVAADLYGAKPARTGEVNRETQYVLDTLQIAAPELITDFTGHQLILVDFNQATQAPPGVQADQVLRIIDHHAVGDFTFKPRAPIYIDIRPWGATGTILREYYLQQGKVISRELAGLMLSAIISDTLHFRSVTTTPADIEAGKDLARIAGIADTEAYAKNMFEAKSALDGVPAKEILVSDYKEMRVGPYLVGMGVTESVKPENRLAQKAEFIEAMRELKASKGLDYLFFNIVDIWDLNSNLLIMGAAEEDIAEEAFGLQSADQVMFIRGMTSRKAQIFPPIQKALEAKAAR